MVTAPQSNLCKVLLSAASIRDSRSQSITGTSCSQCMGGLKDLYDELVVAGTLPQQTCVCLYAASLTARAHGLSAPYLQNIASATCVLYQCNQEVLFVHTMPMQCAHSSLLLLVMLPLPYFLVALQGCTEGASPS